MLNAEVIPNIAELLPRTGLLFMPLMVERLIGVQQTKIQKKIFSSILRK